MVKESCCVLSKERKKSIEIFKKLREVVPGGANSPIRAFNGLGLVPLIVKEAKGDLIVDADGCSYIDYCMSFGPLILGHADEAIVTAAHEQMQRGSTYGASTEIEREIAELITELMPSIEQIRFVSSGTEALMSVLRLTRAYTGRSLFVKFDGNYHGHADPFLVKAGSGVTQLCPESSSKGVPKEVVRTATSLCYNDIEETRQFLREHDVAAVILEPIAGNMGLIPASAEFLHMLREETSKQGALLVFDEVITGFRVGTQGAQGIYGIEPDLTCLGKIIGGGFPAAAFGGKREVMEHLAPEGEVFQAGTLSGNPVAMRAGLETLKRISEPSFFEALEAKTNIFTAPIKGEIERRGYPATLNQIGSCFTLFFGVSNPQNRKDLEHMDHKAFKCFYHYLFEHGVYFPPSPFETAFVSSSHTKEHLEITRDLVLDYLTVNL